METLTIDCGDCRNRGPACSDCVLSVVLELDTLPSFDAEERAAVAALAGQGLVPPLRLLPSSVRRNEPGRAAAS